MFCKEVTKCKSFGITVTRPACIAHCWAHSNKCTASASTASCKAKKQTACHLRFSACGPQADTAKERTTRAKGSFLKTKPNKKLVTLGNNTLKQQKNECFK